MKIKRNTLLALLLVLVMVVMLTGVHHSLLGSTMLVNVVVGFTYFLGIFALYMMYESRLYKDAQTRLLVLLLGFMAVLVAYYSLEALYKSGLGN